jgi:hypothetical protein
MKKVLVVVGVLAVVLIAVLFVAGSKLDGLIKAAIETVGPKVTQSPVTVGGVSLSPRSGSGTLREFVVGNPAGYQAPYAIKVGTARVSVDPKSVLSDKVVIRSVVIDAPEIVLEGGLGQNNLKQLLANIDSFTAKEKQQPADSAAAKKKLQLDEFVLSNAKVSVRFAMLGGRETTVTVPEVRLTNLGAGPEGITTGELSKQVIGELLEKVLPAVTSSVSDLTKGAGDLLKNSGEGARQGLEKAGKGVSDLLKPKK